MSHQLNALFNAGVSALITSVVTGAWQVLQRTAGRVLRRRQSFSSQERETPGLLARDVQVNSAHGRSVIFAVQHGVQRL